MMLKEHLKRVVLSQDDVQVQNKQGKKIKSRGHPTNLNSPGKWPFKHCVRVSAFFVDCSMLLNCMAWSWHSSLETCQRKTCQLYQAAVCQRLCRKYRLGLSTPCVLVLARSSDEGAGTRKAAAH